MLKILFVIFLRNGALSLFITILKLYLQTKAIALLEKKELLKDTGMVMLMPLRGRPINIKIKFVSYFSQHKNNTYIHWTTGKPDSIYSSLSNIQSYLGDYCLRVNRSTIITYSNIISYDEKSVSVKDGKKNTAKTILFFKDAKEILSTLQNKFPKLEATNATPKNDVFGGLNNPKHDEKTKCGGLNRLILDEILNNPGINTRKLVKNFKGNIPLRTLERRLEGLKKAGKIKSKRGGKERGYFILEG